MISRGSPLARLMLIGEAPGAKEEELKEPFVGRSGKLLNFLLKEADIDSQDDVYFCNVVKCRPPKNRRPSKKEINECLPWLRQQIKLVDPVVIILAGSTALETVLGIKGVISNIRGKWIKLEGRFVMPIFHPAYLLRKPSREVGSPFSLTTSGPCLDSIVGIDC